MNFDAEIYKLTSDFYNDYPASKYPELLIKSDRPYNCLLIDTHADYFICIPFRTNIHHNDCYKFKNSVRSRSHSSGLDYQKMVIIKESKYLDSRAVVDSDEYAEVRANINIIAANAVKYLDTYINHINKVSVLHERYYERHYKYSTLPYFHDILNIAASV